MVTTNAKLGLTAVTLELTAIALLFLNTSSEYLLAQYFALHSLACLCITPVAWMLMPSVYKEPKFWVMLLLFSLSFFIPMIGLFGFAIGAMVAAWFPYLRKDAQFKAVSSPQYQLPRHGKESGWRSGRVRQQVSNQATPIDLRMKALLALQHMPARHSSSILRETLSDSADDLRLLAYGMLDSQEKKLTSQIQDALLRFEQVGIDNEAERYTPARELAELYWELVYQNLVQGDMRQFALEQAHHFANIALKHQVKDAGLWVISARVWTLRGDYIRASGAFAAAIRQGFPPVRAEPYLAELAFLRKDYAQTRRIMHNLHADSRSRGLNMAADYWGKS